MFDGIFSNSFLLAQIFGFLAMSMSVIAWQIKNPRHILVAYVPIACLWATQYTLLGAPVAVAVCLSSTFKDGMLAFIQQRYARYIILIYLSVVWIVAGQYIENMLDVFPLLTVTAFNIALLQPDNRSLMSRVNILCQMSWFVFNLSVGAWMGVVCSVLVASSTLIGMARHEEWEIGRCHRSFFPSLARALMIKPQTYP